MDKEHEKIMRNSYKNCEKDSVFYIAMKDSHSFWKAFDYYRNSNKAQIFKKIYMCDDGKNLLIKSFECYVNERTLYRYRNEFVHMFKYFTLLQSERAILN